MQRNYSGSFPFRRKMTTRKGFNKNKRKRNGRGLWASEKPTDEWSERINGGTCEQLVKELGRFVKTKSRKLFRPDAAVLVGKCTIWTKSCETIKSLRESGISFGILKSEDQVAFGKLKSPNM
uniref:Uncharacterized protein n=1 Tax=Caenorhabditis japonica TaxID=281687 RepID=A0A8R1J1P1_CAEJA